MRILLLLVLAMASAWAQNAFRLDLSGAWRMAEGDDSRYARPDFDDSLWTTVTIPQNLRARPTGPRLYLWLRRQVPVTAGIEGRRLALTVGKLSENYQIFVNGDLVGGFGNFTIPDSRLARPLTFDLPPLRGPSVTIAIRCWFHSSLGGPRNWRGAEDTGPWVITDPESAPRDAGPAFLNRLKLQRTPDLAIGVALVVMSLILMLTWLAQRRPELVWLALFDATVAARWLQAVLLITPDSTPWGTYIRLGPLSSVLFLTFVSAALRIRGVRWLEAVAWLVTLATYSSDNRELQNNRAVLVAIASVGMLAWAAVRRGESRVPRQNLIIGASVALVITAIFNDGVIREYSNQTFSIGSWQVQVYALAVAIFTLVMVLDLTQRLLADSREKQRLAGELEAGRTVQSLMLEQAPADTGEYAVEYVYQPAQEVGGDFFQVLADRPDGAVMLVVGDVSGKGLKAAMLVSMVTGVARAHSGLSPAALLAEMNRVVGVQPGVFVTCVAVLFERGGGVTVASGGHLAPYRSGLEVEVESGLPLGVVAGMEYGESRLELGEGDALTFLTDGVVEAANAAGELFGFERTREISGRPVGEIAEAARAWGQNDDITVVTVTRRRG